MVNASLNWASIVGIVLAVCGAGLYFMRSFKPALARDYDVFFAAIGLLCGGILFFQGWRLDPILQFGQFLLAGTTVFFAYESVRLRGVATDQARRSSYFDDEQVPPSMPGRGPSGSWDSSYDQFEESGSLRHRFAGRENELDDRPEEDFYRPRKTSRAAIPEQAASRRGGSRGDQVSFDQDSEQSRRMARFGRKDEESDNSQDFGQRRNLRQGQRRGSRPSANRERTSRRNLDNDRGPESQGAYKSSGRPGIPQGTPIRKQAEDAAFSSAGSKSIREKNTSTRSSDRRSSYSSDPPSGRPAPRSSRPRDNSSRFDD